MAGVRIALKLEDYKAEEKRAIYDAVGRQGKPDIIRCNFLAEHHYAQEEMSMSVDLQALDLKLVKSRDHDPKCLREFSKGLRASYPNPLGSDSKKLGPFL